MPDLVIKKVKAYGNLTALLGIFDFADRNGILFEWNEEVDEFPKGIVKVEDVVLYPSLVCVSDLRLRLDYCKCMRYQSLVPSH
jgi:hypothetical protein